MPQHGETAPTRAELKLSAARTRLILDKPFLGALALRLPLVPADPAWCRTVATDARSFYYNEAYLETLTPAETEFVLAHEALHCALLHFARRQHRVKWRWDIACDLAINPLLIEDGLQPPSGTLTLTEFSGLTAEEIYPLLSEERAYETLDRHVYDEDDGPSSDSSPKICEEPPQSSGVTGLAQAGAGPPAPLSPQEREGLAIRWQQRSAGAAQQAIHAGKLGAAVRRLVEQLQEPMLPWRTLLAHYLSGLGRDDYSYLRPSRREGPALLPGLRSAAVEMIVVLDTSGSISSEEMSAFVSEVNALKGQLRARIVLHACDAALAPEGPWICEPWEELSMPSDLRGGGGTDFTPVFSWIARQDRPPDVLLYFTDARGVFPKEPPTFPVLWLVKGRSEVPWGRRIQLN
ncbi:MAG: vWA domain-containing protein [Acidiferrobacteraceae bacterium]